MERRRHRRWCLDSRLSGRLRAVKLEVTNRCKAELSSFPRRLRDADAADAAGRWPGHVRGRATAGRATWAGGRRMPPPPGFRPGHGGGGV